MSLLIFRCPSPTLLEITSQRENYGASPEWFKRTTSILLDERVAACPGNLSAWF